MSSTATLPYHPTDLSATKSRVSSIDLMRGIVMVIMALDHTRDYIHVGGFFYDATNLETTNPILFFTRWITHYCAPTFVFLAGTSIYFNQQKKNKKDLSLFLLSRGLWLILLEVVVVRFSFFFNFYYDVTFLQVIWVIGAAMVCMAALIHLPYLVNLALGALIVAGHNISNYFPLSPDDSGFAPWAVLEQTGFLRITPDHGVIAAYPLFPWLGIMLLGFALGKLYDKSIAVEKRRVILFRLGAAAVVLFLLIRLINVYGDPSPWSVQKDTLFTVMSFLNTTKYPPSLLYTLMTLGPVLMILSVMERINISSLKPLEVFGRVPLFYYILHFYILHALGLALFMLTSGKSFSELDFHFNKSLGGLTPEAGLNLFWVYVVWVLVVVFLYPICAWYNRYKSTHKHWWLSYL